MTEAEAEAFEQNVDSSAPFWQELHDEDRPTIKIQGRDVPRCLYILMQTRRDIEMYVDHDTKPQRTWKIGDVKKYFGIKGNKSKVKDLIFTIHDETIGRIKDTDNG
ncbi:MAG TPA: hypothetical protein DCF87_00705 [Opitutae bacterium]|nr:hypothetical protein [Opitutae bacterium]|tara:strand:- start:311 stop:628 length:318 start_codon:yes stop_codon:yes gene_type:complete